MLLLRKVSNESGLTDGSSDEQMSPNLPACNCYFNSDNNKEKTINSGGFFRVWRKERKSGGKEPV
jgi:hypothetical protein